LGMLAISAHWLPGKVRQRFSGKDIGQYGGNVEWRNGVQAYHARQQKKRSRTPTETA